MNCRTVQDEGSACNNTALVTNTIFGGTCDLNTPFSPIIYIPTTNEMEIMTRQLDGCVIKSNGYMIQVNK